MGSSDPSESESSDESEVEKSGSYEFESSVVQSGSDATQLQVGEDVRLTMRKSREMPWMEATHTAEPSSYSTHWESEPQQIEPQIPDVISTESAQVSASGEVQPCGSAG